MYDRHSPFISNKAEETDDLTPRTKADFSYERLRTAILNCELQPGVRVSEQEVCDRFGLGRAGTRNALARLSGERLVEALPRSGWRIAPLTPMAIRSVIEARRRLEAALLEEPVSASVALQLEHLAAIIVTMAERSETSVLEAARLHERQFLDLLASGRNSWFVRVLSDLWDASARIVAFFELRTSARFSIIDRKALAVALKADDRKAAALQIEAALNAFEVFVGKALLTLDIDIGGSPAALTDAVPGTAKQPATRTLEQSENTRKSTEQGN